MAEQYKDAASFSTFATKPQSFSYYHAPHNCSTKPTTQIHSRSYTSWAHPTHQSQIIPFINGAYFSSSVVPASTVDPLTAYTSPIATSASESIPGSAEGSQTSRSSVVQTLHSQSVASSPGTGYTTWSKLTSSILGTFAGSPKSSSNMTLQSTTMTTTTPIQPLTKGWSTSTTISTVHVAPQTTLTASTLSSTPLRPAYTSPETPVPSAVSDNHAITVSTTVFVIPTEVSAQSTHQRMMPASKTIAIAVTLGSALAVAIGILVLFLLARRSQQARPTQSQSPPEMTSAEPSTPPSSTPIISKPILLSAAQLPQVYIKSSPVKSPDLRGSLQTDLNPAFLMPPSARSPASLDSWGTASSATPAPSHLSYDGNGNIRRSDPFNLQHIGGGGCGFGAGH